MVTRGTSWVVARAIALIAFAGCTSEPVSACPACEDDQMCGDDGACHQLCNSNADCEGSCEECREGACWESESCAACLECAGDETCYANACVPVCTSDGDCAGEGMVCLAFGAAGVCLPGDRITTHLPVSVGGAAGGESSSASFRVTGGLRAVGGVMENGRYRVVPAEE